MSDPRPPQDARRGAASEEAPPAWLVLADGTTFEGEAAGWLPPGGVTTGEAVFNTVLTGYQEVITDPSYAGQIITFTYPHIGNYGVADDDNESRRPFCRGVVVRDLARRPSNWRAAGSLADFLVNRRVPAITGVDTRRLTRHLRSRGAMPAAFGHAGPEAVARAAIDARATDGIDHVSDVTTDTPYRVAAAPGAEGARRIVAYDFGIKSSILDQLARLGEVEVVPAGTPAAEVLERRPDGVFLSNGPGDPAALPWAVGNVAELVGRVPVFGICLGHQLLGAALGGRTFKLPFGHHGGNQPIRREETGDVEIASHNHNYAVDPASLGPGVEVTHTNLNDHTVGGLRALDRWCFSVQYHPEAGPGPHDPRYLFPEFGRLMDRWRAGTAPDERGESN
jgi:carbamoyl-phosphate synthase small subunit